MFFSLVIPTYNRADYIGITINSLLKQQYEHFEVIVVDDGSTDNTEEVVRSVNDPRVSYFRKNNAERAAARNFGARKAKGDYINFFDSDDVAYPNHLTEAVVACRELGNPQLFHLGYDVKDANGELMQVRGRWPATINAQLIYGNHLSCNGVFVRNDIAQKFSFNETRILSGSEDYELWLRLAARFPVHTRSVVTSTVVNHDGRSVVNINKEKLLARKKALRDALQSDDGFVQRYQNQWTIFDSFLNIYIALHLAMAKYPKKTTMGYLFRAISIRPAVILTRRFMGALKNIWL